MALGFSEFTAYEGFYTELQWNILSFPLRTEKTKNEHDGSY